MNKYADKSWEVVVIGGGPAGMMVAGRAAERGRSVLLLEKNNTLGNKLLLTGGGRCNLTNYYSSSRAILEKYKESKKFLYSAFAQFGVEEVLEFFQNRGIETKIEAEGRVFPVTDRAQTVLQMLVDYMKENGVQIKTGCSVKNLSVGKDASFVIELRDSATIKAKSCVVATGGTSYPETGSTGDGLQWLKKLGHKIDNIEHSLVPIALKDKWVKDIRGVTLDNVKLTSWQNGKKSKNYSGSLLFTHFGISGPMVLNMSREVGLLLKKAEVLITLDILPDLNEDKVREKLQLLLLKNCNKKIKNTLDELINSALVEPILKLCEIDGETPNHSIRKEERNKLIMVIKKVPLRVRGLLNNDKAIYSVGGVRLEEVDFKSMQSRVLPNLYIVGDLLNIDRPSGGYSLQLCWTTGFVAGNYV